MATEQNNQLANEDTWRLQTTGVSKEAFVAANDVV